MRFDCGSSAYARNLPKTIWHAWFAWRPIRLADHDCRWLETIERRYKYIAKDGFVFGVEYRARESGNV